MAKNGLPHRDREKPVIVTGYSREICQWVGNQLDIGDLAPGVGVGIILDGKIIAGIVFHNYRYPAIEASIASISPKWANKRILRELFSYPFVQLKVNNLTVITRAENQSARTFIERLGFKLVGISRKSLPTGDAAVYDMTNDECPWIDSNGKEFTTSPRPGSNCKGAGCSQ